MRAAADGLAQSDLIAILEKYGLLGLETLGKARFPSPPHVRAVVRPFVHNVGLV